MSSNKPSLPKGTRDFGPEQMIRRNYLFNIIKSTFQRFGFLPLETPSMENLSVLTGKYGDEGDQLLFKILNSGNYLSDASLEDFQEGSKKLLPKIAEKGLRYDLTVPFARYVVMNRDLTLPFKRYQIQPVWRADRPQKGRYREFFQCDADVVGTESLICEVEIVQMIESVFAQLGLANFSIKINHRQLLTAITKCIGADGKESDFCVAIDKLDKIGLEKVVEELSERGFSEKAVEDLKPIIEIASSGLNQLEAIKPFISQLPEGQKAIADLEKIFALLKKSGADHNHLTVDITLARGLSYYTGCIFEVKVHDVQIGSVSGGGRYDNLTGVFGVEGIPGVGFSFGVDRLYDVLEELNLFPENNESTSKAIILPFDEEAQYYGLEVIQKIRQGGINAEIYPDVVKAKKLFNYTDKRNIPFAIIIGSEEIKTGKLSLKNMKSGEQESLTVEEIIQKLS
jgi:histidyl-tRNA synthetase